MNFESKLKKVQEHFNFKLTDDYNRPDYVIYSETTADGYEVFVAHESSLKRLNVEENIFYYDNDLSERLEEVIRDYENETGEEYIIYVDDLEYEWIEYAIDEILEHIED